MADSSPPRPGFRNSFLHPGRWPLRWRLTAVLAGLTCLILVGFALVVGRLASNRLHSDFESELTSSARSIAAQVPAVRSGFVTHFKLPRAMTTAPPASACVVFADGVPLDADEGHCFGPVHVGITHLSGTDVATARVPGAVALPGGAVKN